MTELINDDCLAAMRSMAPNRFDSVVTDPPYGLSFMSKEWDHGIPAEPFWREALRVAKPGAYLLAFGGTRTFHRLMVAIEDAGWEIRDTIMWVYGSGFPKSKNVALSIDKGEGCADRGHRVATASRVHPDGTPEPSGESLPPYEARTDAAREWEGFGTNLKPAWEPIVVARRPLEGTVAQNVLKHRTGGLNIDDCRVGSESRINQPMASPENSYGGYGASASVVVGRWPANLIHDGSEEVLELFPDNLSGQIGGNNDPNGSMGYHGGATGKTVPGIFDSGSAARFFYCAKANREDREEGCEAFAKKDLLWSSGTQNPGSFQSGGTDKTCRNNHPTVKPTALMRYLCRLVTPSRGLVLDPFMGSGSTGKAAVLEGFDFLGIEKHPDYVEIARARIAWAEKNRTPYRPTSLF
jgi:site-specific DNA-methyltransferase (adenine-specific)